MNNPITLANFIDGRACAAQSGRYLDVIEPATAALYAYCPRSDAADLTIAVTAARNAAPGWAATSAAERARILNRLADLIEIDLENFAAAESRDSGKPVSLARSVDIPRAIANLRFFAAATIQFASEAHPMENGTINYTVRAPLGVVGCISPWNLPLYLFTWKIAPALAAGNAVIAKPSEVTPLTASMLGALCNQAGLPPGVLNIVHGLGGEIGQALVEHNDVKAISFTGSTRTGATIAATAAPKFKKLSLELGGKNATLIFADAPRARLLDTVLHSAFSNQGQICLCGSRILIERSYYTQFRDAFVARVQALQTGDPGDISSNLGAIVSKAHFDKVLEYIELARAEGGTILCGGHAVQLAGRCVNGCFIAPTVIENLGPQCRTNQEEIFGPVVTLQPFDSDDAALANANSTHYGLAASVWTSDLKRAHHIAAKLEVGIVWINCWMLRDLRTPFGGIKQSGVGREGGWEALRFFTEPKNVCIFLED